MSAPFEGFGLDAQAWADPLAHLDPGWPLRLSRDDHRGLLLDAPERVDPAGSGALPLLAAWGASFAEAAQAPFETHAQVVAMDLLDNRLYGGPAVDLEQALTPPRDPNAPLPRGGMVSLQQLDARERAGLPWRGGEWLLRVLLREHVSNPRRVTLAGDPPAPGDALAADPPGAPLPDFTRRPDSPPPPARGIALAVERVTALRDDPQLVLRGAFRLPARPHEQGVIGISLVLASSLGGPPGVRRLQVPCAAPDAEGLCAGYFALDALPSVARRSHTLFIHAFAGEDHAGPALAALVAAEDLPEGS